MTTRVGTIPFGPDFSIAGDGTVSIGSVPDGALGNSGALRYKLTGASVGTAAAGTDQAITITLPVGTANYRIQQVFISNPSISLTTATAGIFTATGGGGTAVVTGGSALSGLTTNTPGASGSLALLTVNNVSSAFYNAATLYFRVGTGQGTATLDLTIDIQPLN